MAKKDYKAMAAGIIKQAGGADNIVSATHCMTRLRFVLADESIVKDDEVKKIKGDERCARCRTVPDPHRYLCL